MATTAEIAAKMPWWKEPTKDQWLAWIADSAPKFHQWRGTGRFDLSYKLRRHRAPAFYQPLGQAGVKPGGISTNEKPRLATRLPIIAACSIHRVSHP
jgi:hypothetical protein